MCLFVWKLQYRACLNRQAFGWYEPPNVRHQPREPRRDHELREPRAAKRRLDAVVRVRKLITSLTQVILGEQEQKRETRANRTPMRV